jgi:hypothetical protein
MDPDLPRLALKQQGNVTRQQLLALGLGPSAIKYRVRHGKLFPSYPGVYGVGRPAQTPHERASAAVLACGPGAALSHFSALALWGFAGKLRAPFDVAVPADRQPKGIRTHRLKTLHRKDITTQLNIRTTSPARTLLDCVPKLEQKPRARAVNDALRSPYLTKNALSDVVERNPAHPGARLLKPFIEAPGGPTRSPQEDEFPDFCRKHDLPIPLMDVVVHGVERDAYFVDYDLIVELDGWNFHNTREAFESDRNRDADALAHGTPTVRITRDRIRNDPEGEAERLRKILLSRASVLRARSEKRHPSPRGSKATRAARPTPRPGSGPPAR